jgi:aminoglycoside phosphotransferase (APT) family kinase protein
VTTAGPSSGTPEHPTVRRPRYEVDAAALAGWLDERGLGAGEVSSRNISSGAQNVIFEITREGLHCALRMPPPSAPPQRDQGILREWRVLEALNGTDVPHTEALAVCEDGRVLGRPFYLMEFVDGWSPTTLQDRRWPEPYQGDVAARRGLAYALVDGLVALSQVDWRARGLKDFGRPDGFHERQVDRWVSAFEKVRSRDVPGMEETTAWLRQHKPRDYQPGIMHGDYQFANVMFAPGAPARLAAIVDWEMVTIGDPKLDLAWALHSWPDGSGRRQAISYVDLDGMPSREELLQHFSDRTGRQVDDVDYYLVLAKWKLAVVLEQGFRHAKPGTVLEAFGPVVLGLVAEAADLAGSSDYRG